MTPLRLDPRTKLALLLLCVLSAMFAPNLSVPLALVALIGLLAALSGKGRYALRGVLAYVLLRKKPTAAGLYVNRRPAEPQDGEETAD